MKIKTIPMSTEDIMDLFENQDQAFQIDLAGSILKGEAFITYVTNMKIKCSLIPSPLVKTEEKIELMNFFLKFKYLIDCDTLLHTLGSAVLRFHSKEAPLLNDWMSAEELDLFIDQSKDELAKISDFISSMPLTVSSFNKEFKDTVFTPAVEAGDIEVIDDAEAVSVNAFGLITIPHFIDLAVGFKPVTDEEKLTYYKAQVENTLYKKKTFFALILDLKGDSLLMSYFNLLASADEEETNYFKKQEAA
jgi:hypothetical protein